MRHLFLATLITAMLSSGLPAQESDSEKQQNTISQILPDSDQQTAVASFKVQLAPADAQPGDKVTLTIEVTVQDGWHIYPLQKDGETPNWFPTEIDFKPKGLKAIGDGFQCSTEPKEVTIGDEKQLHLAGTFTWKQQFEVKRWAKENHGSGSIGFQVCNDEQCLPPKTLDFDLGKAKREFESKQIAEKYKLLGEPIQVSFEACEKERPKAKLSLASVMSGNRTETVSLKGSFETAQGKLDVYLPKARRYSLANPSGDNTRFENESTYISIDQNQDGQLSETESHATNMPFRIGDEMFAVLALDKASKSMTIQKVDVPLFGTVVGKKLPPFKYKTIDGQTISDKSILGKVTILDIWAVT